MIELAIPTVALGLLYMSSTEKNVKKESFQTSPPQKNYPVEDKEELKKDVRHYELSNSTVDKYFGAHPKKIKKLDNHTNQHFTSLTGQKVTKDGFQHNNMQPFFGSNVRQRIGDYSTAEGILDHMQGAGSTTIN